MSELIPAAALFVVSLALTAFSLWLGGRMAPWFLNEQVEPPTVRSYFLEPSSEMELTRARIVTILGAMAVLLAILLAVAIAVRFGGVGLV